MNIEQLNIIKRRGKITYNYKEVSNVHLQKKRSLSRPLYMFSQRNNPYCDLLTFQIYKKVKKQLI